MKRVGTMAGRVGLDRTGARYALRMSFHCLMPSVRWLVPWLATVPPLVKVSVYFDAVKNSTFRIRTEQHELKFFSPGPAKNRDSTPVPSHNEYGTVAGTVTCHHTEGH